MNTVSKRPARSKSVAPIFRFIPGQVKQSPEPTAAPGNARQPSTLSIAEIQLVQVYRSLDPELQTALLEVIRHHAAPQSLPTTPPGKKDA